MTEIKETLRISALELDELNRVMGRLQDRLDSLEGLRGTPKFYSHVDMGTNRVTNASPSVNTYDGVVKKELTDFNATLIAPTLAVYTPTSVSVIAGVAAAGANVDQLTNLADGSVYEVAEVSATPGFNVWFNFSNVTGFHAAVCRFRYQGTTTHWVGLDIQKTDESWQQLTLMRHTDAYYEFITVYGLTATNYITSANNVKLRSYHYTAGNASHDIYFDYIALLKYVV